MASSDFSRKLFHPSYDNYNILGQLKGSTTSINDFDKKIKRALKHPFTKHVLEATPFPKDYSNINKVRQVNYTNNLAGEIGWYLFSLEKQKEKISDFLAYRELFNRNLLKSNLDKCAEILDKVDSEISISIWSIENRLIIKELAEGSEANWEYLSDVSSKIDNALVLFITECLSKRTEKNISYSRFNNFVNNKIDILGFQPLIEYFNFRLNYHPGFHYSYFPFFLSIESSFPLIDRYLILENIIVEKTNSDDLEKQEVQILEDSIHRLQKISSSKCYFNCLTILNGRFNKISESDEILDLLDTYTEGDFVASLEKSSSILKKRILSIELFEIYVKSLIHLRQDFKPLSISEIADEVMQKLFNIFSRKSSFNEDVSSLLKIANSFISTYWGKQLSGLIHRLSTDSRNQPFYSFQGLVYSDFNNPRILNLIKNPSLRNKFVNEFKEEFGERISLLINKWIVEGDYQSIKKNTKIVKSKRNLYQAKAHWNLGSYENIVKLLANYSDTDEPKFIKEEKINLLYFAYLKNDNVQKALNLFVNTYLDNIQLTNRLSKELLLKKIEIIGMDTVENSIDLPIFFSIASTETYPQYVAYDAYLTKINIDKPSEIDILGNIPKQKLIYFLDNVCKSEVMQYSLAFEGFEEVDNERQDILRILLKIDSNNEDKYIKEIAELTQGSDIRKAIQEVNKGRITVNIPQLKNIESSHLEEGFQRYKKLTEFSKNNKNAKGIDVSPTTLTDYFETLLEESKQDVTSVYNDPAFISFKTIFLNIRDKFLLSKEYGLDGYLSTRIRHGTLENHIRSVFEKHNLLAEKNSNHEYMNINYWDEKTPYSISLFKSNIQEKLKSFSKRIDQYINHITHDLIQVYTEKYNKKPQALFNYNFTPKLLWLMYKNSSTLETHEDFLEYVFNELRSWTEHRLKVIRAKFKNEIKDHFIYELNQLQKEINELTGKESYAELNTSILNSRTDINNEIDRISEWFYLSNPSSNMESDIMTTLRTSVEITNSIYPNHQIKPNYINQENISLIGAVHIIYISRILLDNIIKHSGIQADKIPVDISTEFNSEVLRLGFKHEIAKSSEEFQLLKKTLSRVKKKWKNKSDFEKSNIEGGSGFEKIRRILAFDLKGINYGFDYNLNKSRLEIFVDIDVKLRKQQL